MEVLGPDSILICSDVRQLFFPPHLICLYCLQWDHLLPPTLMHPLWDSGTLSGVQDMQGSFPTIWSISTQFPIPK